MKLTTQQVLRLVEAFQHFDQAPQMHDGKPAREPYKLAGTVRMAMARNIAKLGEVVGAYQKARNGLIYEHAAAGGNTVAADRLADYERAHADLLESTHEIEVIRLSEANLQLDVNEIPVSVLAALIPVMREVGLSAVAEAA